MAARDGVVHEFRHMGGVCGAEEGHTVWFKELRCMSSRSLDACLDDDQYEGMLWMSRAHSSPACCSNTGY